MFLLHDSRFSSQLDIYHLPALGFHMEYQYLWTKNAVIFKNPANPQSLNYFQEL